MRKGILLLINLLLWGGILFAQVPQGFNYQGVVRDASGSALTNQNISLRITIVEGISNGDIFQERIMTSTSSIGVFNVQIGEGDNVFGSFEAIDWSSGEYFIRVELDENGGSDYTDLGTNKLLSVPFAMHAGNGSLWVKDDTAIKYNQGSVSIGNETINPNAILELMSEDKGFLMPRVPLERTSDATPLQAHVEGMVVYNTMTINDVAPGIYYNDGQRWVSMLQALDEVNNLKDSLTIIKNQIPIKRAIIVAGQSNTLFGVGATSIPDLTSKNLMQLGRAEVNLQVVPLTFYGAYHHSRFPQGGSFGTIFMNHYHDQLQATYPDRQINLLMIPCGAGGSAWSLAQYPGNSWRTDAAYFKDLVDRIKWAKANGFKIDAILWHQGESDALGLTPNYKDIVKNFIQSIRDYVGDEELPFILGEMVESWVEANPIALPYQNIINEIPQEVPFTRTSSAEGLTIGDQIHFDAQAHVEMGQRYFDQFQASQSNSNPSGYSVPQPGEYLIYNFNSTSGAVFPDTYSAIRFGESQTDDLYSTLGDIWQYKNDDGYYHFRLDALDANENVTGTFEWKQKINPFGLGENFFEDRSGSIILENTIGINTEADGQGFSSLVFDTPLGGNVHTTLFHADTRAATEFWWFAIGQTFNFSNRIPISETNDTIEHVRLYSIKE